MTQAQVLAVTQTQSPEQLRALIQHLADENAALKLKHSQRGSNIKVSTKGAVSVYGMGRFPVTLYQTQWQKLFTMVDEIKTFIDANKDKLASKED